MYIYFTKSPIISREWQDINCLLSFWNFLMFYHFFFSRRLKLSSELLCLPFIQTSWSTLWCVHRLVHCDGQRPSAKRLQAIGAIGAIWAIEPIGALGATGASGTIGALGATFDGCPLTFIFLKCHLGPLSKSPVSLSCFSKVDRGLSSMIAVSLLYIWKAIGAHFRWVLSHSHVSQEPMVAISLSYLSQTQRPC